MAAAASIPVKQLDDITECPICTELFTDPRVLPCIHTFCLQCIEKWGKDKISGDELACPLCRKDTKIPKDGLAGLPKNFFVGKLLEVRKLASALSLKETLCDVCSDDPQLSKEFKEKATAATYCIECQRNLCEVCLKQHDKFRYQVPHKLVKLKNREQVTDLMQKFPEITCDKHPGEIIKVYCFECKIPTCMMCYIASHNGHKCSDVKQVADEMSRQMKTDTDGFNGKVAECQELLQQLAKEQKAFVENVSKTETEIVQQAEELKQLIEGYKVKLLAELNSARKQQEKKIESVRQELEGRLLMIESFVKYSEELRSKGTACDIARAVSSLHERARELMEFDVRCQFNAEYCLVDIKFVSNFSQLNEQLCAIFGQLESKTSSHEKQKASASNSSDDGLCLPFIDFRLRFLI
jgi:uncharacterized protein YeaO (DUF488 family)